jgi:hypothetical protein
VTDFIEIKGQSGQGYTFRPCADERVLPATGAVLAAAARTRRGWEVAAVAETENLARASFASLFGELTERRDVRVFFRLNVSGARRREDLQDLTAPREPETAQPAPEPAEAVSEPA